MRSLVLLLVLLVPSLAAAAYAPPPTVWDPDDGDIPWDEIEDAWDGLNGPGPDEPPITSHPPDDPDRPNNNDPDFNPCEWINHVWSSTFADPSYLTCCPEGQCLNVIYNEATGAIILVEQREGPECEGMEGCGDECADGDAICDCLAETTAELVAIKGILQEFDVPGIKSLLEQIVESAPVTTQQPVAVAPVPGFEGSLDLPFNGMPTHSVLEDLADQNAGLGDVSEVEQTPYDFDLTITEEGMVPVDVSISTAAGSILGGLGGYLDQVRQLLRGFLLVVVYWNALNHVWNVLLKL